MPALVVEARTFKDPSPKDICLTDDQLKGITDLKLW